MIGVTIGVGAKYAPMAKEAAEAAAKHLSLSDVVILDELHLAEFVGEAKTVEDIYKLKFFAPEIVGYQDYVYFDADWRIRRDPPAAIMGTIHGRQYDVLAVRDRPYKIATAIPGGFANYVNAGFYVIRRRAQALLSWCLRNLQAEAYAEQTAFNRAIQTFKPSVRFLHRAMNWQPLEGPLAVAVDPIAAHGYEGGEGCIQPDTEEKYPFAVGNTACWADGWATGDAVAWVRLGESIILFREDGSVLEELP